MRRLLTCLPFILTLAGAVAWAQGPAQAGPGPGPGPGVRASWSLMTPAERAEHRSKLMSFTRYEDCVAYATEHHKLMQERAKEKGVAIPAAPSLRPCERLRANARSK